MSLYLFWCLIKGPCAKVPDVCGENGECKEDGCAAELKCDCINGYSGDRCEICTLPYSRKYIFRTSQR